MTTSEPPADPSGPAGAPRAGDLRPGTRVEVRTRFDGSWAPGFELAGPHADDGWNVRRLSDGSVLPRRFPNEAVRREGPYP
jgi:hypothetical protein